MTLYFNPREYLKTLKIQYNYLKKFYYHQSSSWLKPKIGDCLGAMEKEIQDYEELIAKYSIKKKIEQENLNLSIDDILGVR